MKIEQRLEELGVELPEPAVPVANYVTTVQTAISYLRQDTDPEQVKVRSIRVNSVPMRRSKKATHRRGRWRSLY